MSYCNQIKRLQQFHLMQKEKKIESTLSKMDEDRLRYLAELEDFRTNPASIVSYLKIRSTRYKQHENTKFLISHRHRKKVIELHERDVEANAKQLANRLLFERIVLPRLTMVPKLDQIASKMCLTLEPQMGNEIVYKSETSKILREILDQDQSYKYPNEVFSLVSLSFDEPYEPLVSLLIDDGIPNRLNRNILLNPKYAFGGLASIKSAADPQLRCTVLILTDQVQLKNKSPPYSQNKEVYSSNIRVQPSARATLDNLPSQSNQIYMNQPQNLQKNIEQHPVASQWNDVNNANTQWESFNSKNSKNPSQAIKNTDPFCQTGVIQQNKLKSPGQILSKITNQAQMKPYTPTSIYSSLNSHPKIQFNYSNNLQGQQPALDQSQRDQMIRTNNQFEGSINSKSSFDSFANNGEYNTNMQNKQYLNSYSAYPEQKNSLATQKLV